MFTEASWKSELCPGSCRNFSSCKLQEVGQSNREWHSGFEFYSPPTCHLWRTNRPCFPFCCNLLSWEFCLWPQILRILWPTYRYLPNKTNNLQSETGFQTVTLNEPTPRFLFLIDLLTVTLQTGFCDDLTSHKKFFLSTLVKGTLKRKMLLLASLSKDIPCDGKSNWFWMWASWSQ